MLQLQDIRQLNEMTSLLAGGLAAGPVEIKEIPLEVSVALTTAQQQMAGLPEVIADLNQAYEKFLGLSQALGRMRDLAEESGRLSDSEIGPGREALEDEFIDLAKVVALEAGRHSYAGPHLSLKSQSQALAASKILKYMDPVLDNLSQELSDQKALVNEVIDETVNFLGILVDCYPNVEGLSHLSGLVGTIKRVKDQNLSAAGTALH